MNWVVSYEVSNKGETMRTIEFEAMTFQHTIRIPDEIPDGMILQVSLIMDDEIIKKSSDNTAWKNLLATMPDIGCDADFSRTLDYGREIPWDS